ncbi:MAG: hypothetical protein EBR82_49555, partial [Caulobacteraceae bacterium]|nr:hypothetical protein [Caulobacteraceae bacterium]
MARISATQKLVVEDFPDQKDWIGKMLLPINDFISKVLGSVNGNIEFGSNIVGIEKELDFIYVNDATSLPQKIKWTLSQRPRAYYLVAAYEGIANVNSSFSPVTLCANYIINQQNEVEVNGIVKLTSSGVSSLTPQKRYKILIRIT